MVLNASKILICFFVYVKKAARERSLKFTLLFVLLDIFSIADKRNVNN